MIYLCEIRKLDQKLFIGKLEKIALLFFYFVLFLSKKNIEMKQLNEIYISEVGYFTWTFNLDH